MTGVLLTNYGLSQQYSNHRSAEKNPPPEGGGLFLSLTVA